MSIWPKVYRGIGVTLAILAGLGLIISSIPLAAISPNQTPPQNIFPSDSPASSDFEFEVVDTEETRAKGLSGRTEVPSNYGMLFVLPEPGTPGFWMNDMLVPIDILWINEAGVLVAVEENVSPDTYPKMFYPPSPISYVLETRPAEYKAQGWSIGDTIPLP